jgi:hypothetical protein
MKKESDPYLNSSGVYDLDVEWEVRWKELSNTEKDRHIKYLKMICFFRRYPKAVKFKDKQWIFANMDVEIDIIPMEWHDKYNMQPNLSVTTNTSNTVFQDELL